MEFFLFSAISLEISVLKCIIKDSKTRLFSNFCIFMNWQVFKISKISINKVVKKSEFLMLCFFNFEVIEKIHLVFMNRCNCLKSRYCIRQKQSARDHPSKYAVKLNV